MSVTVREASERYADPSADATPRPVLRAAAGLHADQARRAIGEMRLS